MGVKYSEFYMKNLSTYKADRSNCNYKKKKNLLIGSGNFTLPRSPWEPFSKVVNHREENTKKSIVKLRTGVGKSPDGFNYCHNQF